MHDREECGNVDGPDHERIGQHAERESEPQFLYAGQCANTQGAKRSCHDESATGNDAACFRQCDHDHFFRAMNFLFFVNSSHEKDVVVLACRNEDDKQK